AGEGVECFCRGYTHRAGAALPCQGTRNQGAQAHDPRVEKRRLSEADHYRRGPGGPARVETSPTILRAIAAETHPPLAARAAPATALPATGRRRPHCRRGGQGPQRLELLRLHAGERTIEHGGGA